MLKSKIEVLGQRLIESGEVMHFVREQAAEQLDEVMADHKQHVEEITAESESKVKELQKKMKKELLKT